MHLGIGSYTYTWAIGVSGYPPRQPLTAAGLLNQAAALGVGVVQICDNLPLDRLPLGELAALGRQAKELGLRVEVGARGIADDRLDVYLQLARRFGSPICRVVLDTSDHHPPLDEIVSTLRAAMPDYERAEVTLAVENHDRFTAVEFVRILERVGSDRVGICLDTVNSFGALEGPQVVVETLSPWTVSLHIKDFAIRRVGHAMGFVVEGTPAGQGRLDVPWLLEALARSGRDPNAILELWTPPQADVEATIALEEAWARESVQNLRRWIPG